VAVGAHTQSDHGVHTGIVFYGQVLPNILKVGVVGRYRIAGPAGRNDAGPLMLRFGGFGIFPIDLP
jgi:hypothetical protein